MEKLKRGDIDRGHDFAEGLYELVYESGPSDLNTSEKDALASHLISVTIEWTMARNRRAALTNPEGEG